MTVTPLARQDWHPFLESFTRTIRGRQAAVEVASADLGDQRLIENVPLLGLSYDTRGDQIEIEFETLGHRVAAPTELSVDQLADGTVGLEIVGGDGAHTIVRLKEPLLLPEPAHG